ncbi:MAG: OPT family oligopeptide transporter [Sandaracinaceae bacterium]
MADASADEPIKHGEEEEKEILYEPPKGELQLTVRSVVAGCLLGGVVSAMNIYFGLKTGWAIGGSLIAALLGFAIFKVLGPALKTPYTRLEANITQTAGSGAGTMTSAAGLLSAIPAMGMLYAEDTPGVPDLGYFELTFWGLSVAFLGIFFAIPLRKQMVVQEKLRFPTGTATAHTLMAMFADGADAMQKAKILLVFSLGAGLFTLLSYFVPEAQMVPLHEWIPITLLVWLAGLSFKLYISPLMFGAGILIGFRVAASLALGAVVAWRFLGPWADAQGWTGELPMSKWILWPGVAIMVADALTSLALSWPTIARSLKFRKGDKGQAEAERDADKSEQISFKVWAIGMSLASAATMLMAWIVFDITPWMSAVAIALSSVLAMIATRSTGETDINPIGGMGKVTQLVFGGLAQGSIVTNLMSAAISSAGASQSGDMMQDLKTGHMLGAAPKKQLIAQIAGVVFGILFAVPIYMLFDSAYDIGHSEQMPAPAAHSWKAMAELLVQGFDALPQNAEYAIAAGFAFGCIIPIVRKFAPKGVKDLIPSGLAFGIAFIVPAFYSISMFIGALIFKLFSRANPKAAKNLGFAIASGLIAGEGLMGIVNAVLTLLQVPTLTGDSGGH